MADAYAVIAPLVHCLPPEVAHGLGLWALRNGWLCARPMVSSPSLAQEAFGLSFPNPVGLAAGFDKNAVALDGLLQQGFGFVEAGTVTPRPQPGNAKPRIFRLREDKAVINRLGFNNGGLDNFVKNLKNPRRSGIVGANIGRNKDASDAVADYVTGLDAVYRHADYITVNISSPNTPGLRAMQQRETLKELLAALRDRREACAAATGKKTPLLLKIAPDLGQKEREDIAELALSHEMDGLIVSNTTIARSPSLISPYASEQGGLSGCPLFAASTDMLKEFYRLTHGRIPIIGVGGIASAADAYAKIRAGATLVQLYTALVYQGFSLVRRIIEELPQLLAQDGFSHITQAIGADAR